MKKIFLALAMTCCFVGNSFSQDLDEALRYIKVGNTYREVDEYNLSEYYLTKAVNLITTKFPTQKYWEAAAYENLGLLYRDHDEQAEAQKYFTKALDIYQKWYSYVEKFAGISGNKDGLPQLPDGEFLPPHEQSCVEKHFTKEMAKHYNGTRPIIIGRCAHLTKPQPMCAINGGLPIA